MKTVDRTQGIDMDALFESVKNWGRWGDDDERGALNLITDQRRAHASTLVVKGRAVSCANDIPTRPSMGMPTPPALHLMARAGDCCGVEGFPGLEMADDYIGMHPHGAAITHVDAFCHMFVNGHMYNGRPASEVTSMGALKNAISVAFDGFFGRGIFLDIPRLRGVEWLDAGENIMPDELDAAEQAVGITTEPGDIVLVSTGRAARFAHGGHHDAMDGLAGLDPRCAAWIHDKDIAVLCGDGGSDPLPPNTTGWPLPIHQTCLVAMGVHLMDNVRMDRLAAVCVEEERWEFLFSAAPLRVAGATGSPINPIGFF
jgi:kynurenine formamidase